eukprot:3150097-Rhodomonas_salina.4
MPWELGATFAPRSRYTSVNTGLPALQPASTTSAPVHTSHVCRLDRSPPCKVFEILPARVLIQPLHEHLHDEAHPSNR